MTRRLYILVTLRFPKVSRSLVDSLLVLCFRFYDMLHSMRNVFELPPASAASDPNYDGVIAAPSSHVVVYEDEDVRELVVILGPGVRDAFHHHARRSEMRVYRSASLRYYRADGSSVDIPKKEVTSENPFIEQLDPELLHSVENLSDSDTYYALRIEFKH